MTLPVEWTPDLPLRFDATDEQIAQRLTHIFGWGNERGIAQVVREFATAVQAEADKKIDAIVTDGGIVAVLEAHHAAEVRIAALESQLASARRDAARLDWLQEKSQLANGVEIETTAWDAQEHEHRSVAYHSGTEGRRINVSWGPKLGHFAHQDSLREAIDNAMQREVPPPPGT